MKAHLPAVFYVGMQPGLVATLANLSADTTFRVIQPGDGSEVGWREPYVYWTAEIDRGNGVWAPVDSVNRGRCGLMNPYGDEAVVRLDPGGELRLFCYEDTFEFLQPGKVRMTAHYEYGAGRFGRVPPTMQGVEPFAVVSAPVAFEVVRPYELRVTVKKPLAKGADNRLTDHFDVQLFNRTGKAIACESEGASNDGKVTLAVYPWRLDNSLKMPRDAAAKNLTCNLRPNESVSLVEAGLLAGGAEGTWTIDRPARVQAECSLKIDGQVVPLRSEWVDVTVEK